MTENIVRFHKDINCCKNTNIKNINDTLTCINCGVQIIKNNNKISSLNYMDDIDMSTDIKCDIINKDQEQDSINNIYLNISSWVPRGSKNYIYSNGVKKYIDISRLHSNCVYNYKRKSYLKTEVLFDKLLLKNGYNNIIINKAKKLWTKIINMEKITRKGSRLGLIASCIYYSCDGLKTSIEICDDLNIKKTDLTKGLKMIRELLSEEIKTNDDNSNNYFGQYILILVNENIIMEKQINEIIIICNKIYEELKDKILNVTPKSIIIGIIFFVGKYIYEPALPIDKNKLSKIYNICIPTLNKIIKKIEKIHTNIHNKNNNCLDN